MTKFLNISTDTTLGGDTPSDALVVSQKAIAAVLATKQPTLVSGTNIKTVNGASLLGSGDITISSSVNWGYIGGTLTNQTDLKNALDAKQNTITNLSTIESGAAAGATAVQPGDLATVATSGSYNDLSNKPTIPTVTPPDNSTIVTASSKLQAVALKNQNTASGATTPIPQWVGTVDQYNSQSVATSHPDWLCFITNKTQSALSHYLVAAQYPNSSNSYTWYFKYSDGWVEQGGFVNATQYNTTTQNVNFMIAMADTNYFAIANPNTPDHQGTWAISARCAVKTTTGMAVHGSNNANSAYTGNCSWMVAGMAAS